MTELNSTNFVVAETIPTVVRSERELSQKNLELISNTHTRADSRVTDFFDEQEVVLKNQFLHMLECWYSPNPEKNAILA